MKNIILLGSTGSVGTNVLDVVRRYPGHFRVKAIASNENINSLIKQAEEFKPEVAVIGNQSLHRELAAGLPKGVKALAGSADLEKIAAEMPADVVFMAISGTAALKPLVAALGSGRTVALASKEPVVSAGMIIRKVLDEKGGRIIPVDSEHSAVMQCLGSRKSADVGTLYITGSGGPLKDRTAEDFDALPLNEILNHPKWSMGRKITVDSATLMNKGLEVIEAKWLFDVPAEKIKVVIHPEAVIHAMVEFADGTISAGMFSPDMRFPILRALAFPDIMANDLPKVDFSVTRALTFFQPDNSKFPALDLAYGALRAGGTAPAVLNSANEAAVNLFLEGKIKFSDIVRLVRKAVEGHVVIKDPALDDIMRCHSWAIEEVFRSC